MHTPDNWVIVKITRPEGVIHKVLAGWPGSWRMNSGIVRAEVRGEYTLFYGESGSVYKCHKDAQRLSALTAGIYESLFQRGEQTGITVEIVDGI